MVLKTRMSRSRFLRKPRKRVIKNYSRLICQQYPLPDLMKIKNSSDGAKTNRISNFIVISFSMVFNENFSVTSKQFEKKATNANYKQCV